MEEQNERLIQIPEGYSLEEVVYMLQRYRDKGQKVYCIYKGVELHSETITTEEAWKLVENYDPQKQMQRYEKYEEKRVNRRDKIGADDRRRIELVKEARKLTDKQVHAKDVIYGIKYIAEHRDLSQDDLVNGLIELNCTFTNKDVQKQSRTKVFSLEDFRNGRVSAGAYVIVNMRDCEEVRKYFDEKFFSQDVDYSAYNFIRELTGDKSYTKEYVDSISNGPSGKSF